MEALFRWWAAVESVGAAGGRCTAVGANAVVAGKLIVMGGIGIVPAE